MTMPHPQPPSPAEPRPGVPLPGQHLAGADPAEFADPAEVRAQVDALLAELTAGARDSRELAAQPPTGRGGGAGVGIDTVSAGAGADITRRAHILEQAHEVLVRALTTVDKI